MPLIEPSTAINAVLALTALSVAASWLILVTRYGSISFILNNAYSIRVTNIGADTGLLPVYFTYLNSLSYAAFALSLAEAGIERRKAPVLRAAAAFVTIFLTDLMLFGRIGMVYAIFCIAGFFIVYRVRGIFTPKRIAAAAVLFAVLVSPRVIRRAEGHWDLSELYAKRSLPFLRYEIAGPAIEVVETYLWYASSVFALDYYLEQTNSDERTGGERTATPVFRAAQRIGLIQGNYISTIDGHAGNLPYPYNVYTVIRDIYGDFGAPGLIVVPCLFGLYFGQLFNSRRLLSDAQIVYLTGWIFYSPLYNAFSFGQFVISFAFLGVLSAVAKAPRASAARRVSRADAAGPGSEDWLRAT